MVKPTRIVLLGSTGSIGRSTLKVVAENPDRLKVVGLGCKSSLELLVEQIRLFSPQVVAVDEGRGQELAERLGAGPKPVILEGMKGQVELAGWPGAEMLVAAMVGSAGIKPVLAGIEAKKQIALANKETIVLAGELIMAKAKENKVSLWPVDSEHNAIHQSLAGSRREDLHSITLTASGGPFLHWPAQDFEKIRLADALNHPKWSMGKKISVDSATLMNKGLEVIEAKWLFGLGVDQIKELGDPESILHSLVSFKDGSSIGQFGQPDMCVPIAYCLGQGLRLASGVRPLDFGALGRLTFEKPDLERFGCLKLAFEALRLGGGAPAALSGANEEVVADFLAEKIHFTEIPKRLAALMVQLSKAVADPKGPPFLRRIESLNDALAADAWGRQSILV